MLLPVLTRTCARAYPYLCPCLPVPAPVLLGIALSPPLFPAKITKIG